MPNLDTYISSSDQGIIDRSDQQAKDDREREAEESAKSELTECRELVEALADKAALRVCTNAEKYAARYGCLTIFLAVWAMRIPEIKADIESQL